MFRAIAQQRNRYLQRYQEALEAPFLDTPTVTSVTNVVNGNSFPLGYQNKELPQIIAKLNGAADRDTQIRVLNTLSIALKSTELLLEAINRLGIVKRLAEILHRTINDPDDQRHSLVCETLQLIAKRHIGAQKIIMNDALIANLFKCIAMDNNNRASAVEATIVLEFLTIFPRVASLMIEKDFLQRIKYIIDDCSVENEHLYSVLTALFQEAPALGIQQLYFELLLRKLHAGNVHLTVTLKCFAVLINCHLGQHLCDIFDVMRIFNGILMTHGLASTLYEAAALALQNSTHSDVSQLAVSNYAGLPEALVNHARTKTNAALQIYTLQCLRHITENRMMKLIVRRNLLPRIKSISILDDKAREIRSKLVVWLNCGVFDEVEGDGDDATDR